DRPAWGRLCQLLTRGNLRAEKGDCILRRDDLLDFAEGLELIVMPHGTRNLSSPSPRSSRGEGRGEGDRLSARHSASETLRLAEAPPHPESADADSDLSPREVGFTRLRHDIGASRKHPTCAGRGARGDVIKHILLHLREAAPRRLRLAALMPYGGNDR